MSPPELLWDNWIVRCAGDGLYHRFSLCAPGARSPDQRHARARIHHWTSPDLASWAHLGPALELGAPGAFDDGAHWCGCAADLGDRLALFFTGVRQGPGDRQSIGAAFSQDGRRFTKLPAPVLVPDASRGYDLGDAGGVPMAWRDPYVFADRASGERRMVFGAKAAGKGACVGLARSRDPSLTRWEALPPLPIAAAHAQIEVVSLIEADGGLFCLFSSTEAAADDPGRARFSVRAYRADALQGPWVPAGRDEDLLLGPGDGIYALTPFRDEDGSWRAAGFRAPGQKDAFRWAAPMRLLFEDGAVRAEA